MLVVGLRKPINSNSHPVVLHNVRSRPKPHRHIGLLDPPYALVRNTGKKPFAVIRRAGSAASRRVIFLTHMFLTFLPGSSLFPLQSLRALRESKRGRR
jgi:hypothetical protein